jgi:uncharacterized protein (DUF433 family)
MVHLSCMRPIREMFIFAEKHMVNYKSIITRNPNKRFGKPCIRETRITVFEVLGWLASDMTYEEIITDFPELTIQDIKACLAFAADREHNLQYS